MTDELLSTLEALERRGWDALCAGTAGDFYGETMAEDGVMVLAHGQSLTREQVVASLREAPGWDRYQLSGLRVVPLGADAAALVYEATATRDGQPPFTALMSSVYARDGDGWSLALYTQTPVPG